MNIMRGLVATCGGKVVYETPCAESRWSGDVESNRKLFIEKAGKVMHSIVVTRGILLLGAKALAPAVNSADQIRTGFMQLIDVFTAITEPILWFYALTACILMATGKNKDLGWSRLKNVGYAYIAISLLPTFFAFLRWVAKLIGGSMQL